MYLFLYNFDFYTLSALVLFRRSMPRARIREKTAIIIDPKILLNFY